MFSMCSELTPRARIPDTRIPQLMQPWPQINKTLQYFVAKAFFVNIIKNNLEHHQRLVFNRLHSLFWFTLNAHTLNNKMYTNLAKLLTDFLCFKICGRHAGSSSQKGFQNRGTYKAFVLKYFAILQIWWMEFFFTYKGSPWVFFH